MAKFKIQTGKENEILRVISAPVEKIELKAMITLAENMIKYVKDPDNGGVGLAAPQIWTNKRVIVVAIMKTRDDDIGKIIGMINPIILEHSEECELGSEGCLSVPGEFGDVIRYKTLKVNYIDTKGKEIIMIFSGFTARIIQHEIDHLDGVLFTDKIVEKKKNGTVE